MQTESILDLFKQVSEITHNLILGYQELNDDLAKQADVVTYLGIEVEFCKQAIEEIVERIDALSKDVHEHNQKLMDDAGATMILTLERRIVELDRRMSFLASGERGEVK